MEFFLEKYNRVISNENSVFYYCNRTCSFLIMQKMEGTKTNENRKHIINAENSRYRANKLRLVMIIDGNDGKLKNCPVKISYRTAPNNFEWNEYKIGDIIGGDERIFNQYTMYYGISFFKTFERAYHEHLLCIGKIAKVINEENNSFTIETYDSFGKNITKNFSIDTNEELFSINQLIEPLFVILNKKINKMKNFIYA